MFLDERVQYILDFERMVRVQICFWKREMMIEDVGEKFFKKELDFEGSCK